MVSLYLMSLTASIGITLSSSVIGNLLLWHRMAFFADTIAHCSLLGVALALLFSLPIEVGAISIAIMIAMVFNVKKYNLGNDTLLAAITYGSLAFAIALMSKISTAFDMESFLFGEILVVNYTDILITYIIAIITICWAKYRWQNLLLISIDNDLAASEKVNAKKIHLEIKLIAAIFIAISIKIVGALLISALLIIPSAAARIYSSTPEEMLKITLLISVICAVVGISASFIFDLPVGASIAIIATIIFVYSYLIRGNKN